MEVVERRLREREKVVERAKAYSESRKGRVSAFLVGSYARGDFNVWSDVDIVLIADFQGSVAERLENLEAPPGFEIIPLTPEEALRAARKRNPLIVELAEVGVKLRDDLNVEEEIRKALAESSAREPARTTREGSQHRCR